jgi:catechol 2,3-dioxygenase-like lactoylglutathione lyase family enzyme
MKLTALSPMLRVSDLKRTMSFYDRPGFHIVNLRDPDGYWLWFGPNTPEPQTVED